MNITDPIMNYLKYLTFVSDQIFAYVFNFVWFSYNLDI